MKKFTLAVVLASAAGLVAACGGSAEEPVEVTPETESSAITAPIEKQFGPWDIVTALMLMQYYHAGVTPVQLFTGFPLIRTVQAPQLVVSQPMCVPVSDKSSRMKCTSSVRASTERDTLSPLMVRVTSCSLITCLPWLVQWPAESIVSP